MGRQRQYDHDEIFRLYEGGLSPREIGERTGANPDYLGKLIYKAGISRKPGRPKRVVRCVECGSTNTRAEIA